MSMRSEATAPPLSPGAPPLRHAFSFTGSGSEYFRIWIVNLCLTIVTLGLYGPWAKVRKRKYFYGNLVLDGASFAYDADPRRILIGRLIVLFCFAALTLTEQFTPVGGLVALVWIPLFPWLTVRSLAFHRRCSSYRGVRFGFRAGYGETGGLFLASGLAILLTAGLAYPWFAGRWHQFLASNSRYGGTPFDFGWRAGPYYRAFALGLGTALVVAAAVFVLLAELPLLPGAEPLPFVGALVVGYLALSAVTGARLLNLFYNQASLADARLASTVRGRDLVALYGLGGIAVVLSLGLLIPWLTVRIARYRAERLELTAASLDSFAREAAERESRLGALAEEAAGFFDFDFGV